MHEQNVEATLAARLFSLDNSDAFGSALVVVVVVGLTVVATDFEVVVVALVVVVLVGALEVL